MKFDYEPPKRKKNTADKLIVETKPRKQNSVVSSLSEENKKNFERSSRRDCLERAYAFGKIIFTRLPENLQKELIFYFQLMEANNGGPKGRKKLISMITKAVFEKILEIRKVAREI